MREVKPGKDVKFYKIIQLLLEPGLNFFGDFSLILSVYLNH